MPILNNTVGGCYEYNPANTSVAYTFPENAYVDIDGVKINIGGLKVQSYSDSYNHYTVEFFAKIFASLPSNSSNDFNSKIVISDSHISDDGMPSLEDFEKFNIHFISKADFNALQKRVTTSSDPDEDESYILFKYLLFFMYARTEGKAALKAELASILSSNNYFPKRISLLYIDCEVNQITHIVLTYSSLTECKLQIDNTLSPIMNVEKSYISVLEKVGIDTFTCKEEIPPNTPNIIKFYKNPSDQTSIARLELPIPVSEIFINQMYKRMIEILTTLDIPIKSVDILHPFNQKSLPQCLPFSLQGKINFTEGNSLPTTETAFEAGTRMRAEHAILAYLFKKAPRIEGEPKSVSSSGWYANYREMCKALDEKIGALPYPDIEKLYLAIELDGVLSLSPLFKKPLLSLLQAKLNHEEYVEVPSFVPSTEAEHLQETMAPRILYNNNKNTLFYSRKHLENIEVSIENLPSPA